MHPKNTVASVINVRPVILYGGSGARLWPLSRYGFPKQFLSFEGKESLFQQAALRLKTISGEGLSSSSLLIVTNEEHRYLALEQLREIGVEPGAVILEPEGKNTAPALTLAALAAVENGEDPVLVVVAADQAVVDAPALNDAIKKAISQALEGDIVVFGVVPDRPETGYGYIQALVSPDPAYVVRRFVEKPNESLASHFLADGGYFWNAGMFVLKASVWLRALENFRVDIAVSANEAWARRLCDGAFVRPGSVEFSVIPTDSIDCAVIERCPGSAFKIKMIPLNVGWTDLGSWGALWDFLPKDENGNSQVGDVLAFSSHNSLAYATSRLVTLVGVYDMIVVETPDALLVANKACSQEVKRVVSQLQITKREEHLQNRKVHRPWGWYDCIDEGERFKVKRIQVNPGASLSLQKHSHRAEHWVIVNGTAEITCGDQKFLLTENQSTYIPVGEVHRLSNPGGVPLEIIEVQSGGYLGEDDIVRFDDCYGRNST